jgi:iron complex transport system substrate-binding protein
MRIVSLISSATEILFAIGAGEQVVAVSHECDYPAAAQHLPKATRSRIDSSEASGTIDEQVKSLSAAGGALYDLDAALIRDLAPDLIVTQAQCDVCAVRYADVLDLVAAEPALVATRVLALNPQSLDEVLADVLRVGQACDLRDVARAYVAGLVERVGRVALTKPLSRPRVVCIEWTEPLMTAGNWTPQLVELAGGLSGLAKAGAHSGYVPWSAIAQFDPEVLIVAPCGFDLARSLSEARALTALPGFGDLAAVRAGRAHVVDGNAYLNRSSPRLVDSLEMLAHLIQPALFPPPSGELVEGVAWVHFPSK